jgi:hypothetical protein
MTCSGRSKNHGITDFNPAGEKTDGNDRVLILEKIK